MPKRLGTAALENFDSGLSCISLFCVPGHSYSIPQFQLLSLVSRPSPHLQLGSVHAIAHEISAWKFHRYLSGAHHLPSFLHPPQETPGSPCVHFKKYYPVVKLSNAGVVLDPFIFYVYNFYLFGWARSSLLCRLFCGRTGATL